MKISLRNKLSVSYIFVALVCISLLSVLTNFFLDRQFRQYVEENQEQKNRNIVHALSKQYDGNTGWKYDILETIGVNALENGTIIKVKDQWGRVLWDATVHNNGMCQKIIETMASNLNNRYQEVQGAYVEKPYSIVSSKNTLIGTVLVGYYGPFYLSDSDLDFIDTLNKILIGVGIVSLLLSFFLGTIMAARISKPISGAIQTAKMIAKGCYTDRVKITSNTREMLELSETVNHLAQTLETQELLRKRLSGDVAHEIRTPLATVQSHLEAMIDGVWKADADRLKSCHEEVLRIARLIGDLEKLAVYESGNVVLHKSECNASEVCRRLLHNFENEFKAKNINIQMDASDVILYADQDMICQVFTNVISNALKFTLPGGKVFVEIQEDGNDGIICVKDTGVGIPEENLPYVFERFYRADQSRNRLTGGSGIGLTITKAIVDAHGGSIDLKSQVNVGTAICIRIPKSDTR